MADDLFSHVPRRFDGHIRILEAKTADEFVAALRPSRAEWWDNASARRTHIFRGQGDSSWPLLPNGLRPLGPANRLTSIYRALEAGIQRNWGPRPESLKWVYALSEATTQFAALGRQVGLETPWDVPASVLTPEGLAYSAPTHDLGLLALAQHHRIPTLLLDWSEDPLTAAFFALDTDDLEASHLAVWALTANPTSYDLPHMKVPYYQGRILLVRSSTAGKSNIRAQSGMFMQYEAFAMEEFGDKLCRDGIWRGFESFSEVADNLTKVTLPRSEREPLRRLLLAEGRSAAHLMPSWDQVSSTLFDRWDRPSF
jgi:hypothetical protein